jgi:hypothetical protein
VLSVAVDLDGEVVVLFERVAEARLHRGADPEIERQPKNMCAAIGGDVRGVVARAVVDDDDIEARIVAV